MELKNLVEEYGAANVRFFVPMHPLIYADIIPGIAFTNCDGPGDVVECVIDETRYTVSDGYKITLRAVNPVYGKKHFYQSDLETILRHHPETNVAFTLSIDGYHRVTFQ